MNICEEAKFDALNSFVSHAARDLELLKAIDITISNLLVRKEGMLLITEMVLGQIERVKHAPNIIDENGSIVEHLEAARDLIGAGHAIFVKKCEAAKCAKELHDDDGVVEAYYDTLNAAADLHNALNTLCWTIGEHDVDLEDQWLGPFNNVEDMLHTLRA